MALPTTVVAAALATSNASAMPAALVDSTIKVAMTVSAGLTAGVVPASIATLSQGVLRAMFLTNLKMISVAVLLGAAAVATVAVVAQQSTSSQNAPRNNNPAQKPARDTPSRADEAGAGKELPGEAELIYRSEENLRRIAEAIQGYTARGPGDVSPTSRFPSSAIFRRRGRAASELARCDLAIPGRRSPLRPVQAGRTLGRAPQQNPSPEDAQGLHPCCRRRLRPFTYTCQPPEDAQG